MTRNRFSIFAYCAAVGALLATSAPAETRNIKYTDCERAAVETYIKLLFPESDSRHVIAFAGEVEGVRIDLTGAHITPRVLAKPDNAEMVFMNASAFIREIGEEGNNPKIYLFGVNQESDLAKAPAQYRTVYQSVVSVPADRLKTVHSGPCTVYAEHDNGKINRMIIVVGMDDAGAAAFSADVSVETRNAAHAKHIAPVEICLSKTGIALEGAWGIFALPDTQFSVPIPSVVHVQLGMACIDRVWTKAILPGMTKDEVRRVMTTFEPEE